MATADGRTVAYASRRIGVTEPTFYRWRAEYEGCEKPPRLNRPDVPVVRGVNAPLRYLKLPRMYRLSRTRSRSTDTGADYGAVTCRFEDRSV